MHTAKSAVCGSRSSNGMSSIEGDKSIDSTSPTAVQILAASGPVGDSCQTSAVVRNGSSRENLQREKNLPNFVERENQGNFVSGAQEEGEQGKDYEEGGGEATSGDGGSNGGVGVLHQPLHQVVTTTGVGGNVAPTGGIQRRVVVVGNTAHLVTIHPAPAPRNTDGSSGENGTNFPTTPHLLGVGGDGTQIALVGGRLLTSTTTSPSITIQGAENIGGDGGEFQNGGIQAQNGGVAVVSTGVGGTLDNGQRTISVVSQHSVDLRVKTEQTTSTNLLGEQQEQLNLSDRPNTVQVPLLQNAVTANIKHNPGTQLTNTVVINTTTVSAVAAENDGPPSVVSVAANNNSPAAANTQPQQDTMIDTSDFRMSAGEPTYQTLSSAGGRMTPPGYLAAPQGHYATLTPLQPMTPLPPISSIQMGEKFGYPASTTPNVSGSFTVMQNNSLAQISIPSPYSPYDSKLVSMGMSPPHFHQGSHMGLHSMQHSPTLSPTHPYATQNGLHSPHKPISPIPYEYRSSIDPQSPHDLSPTSGGGDNERSPTSDSTTPAYSSPSIYTSTALTTSHNPSLNGMASLSPHNISPHHSPSLPTSLHHSIQRDLSPPSPTLHHQSIAHPSPILPPTTILHHPGVSLQQQQHQSMKSPNSTTSSSGELEEINTKELAQRISAELKRYSIPQAIFAQRVLCRSQGTLSDLLRNPKPWSKLKSGRETFRRMFKCLQEPEFQRMPALRFAGKASFLSWIER